MLAGGLAAFSIAPFLLVTVACDLHPTRANAVEPSNVENTGPTLAAAIYAQPERRTGG